MPPKETPLDGLHDGALYKYVKDDRLFKCPTGNPDLHKVQRAVWGKLGYTPQPY